ncbi:hypothetical protein LFZ31_24890 [Salmonella enterica subsp. enterica serovar Newport str. S09097]|nr:hypothetical protein LFZ31_24890 [Salmonella enterica subsp. enterica serovar Newport str. S09097]
MILADRGGNRQVTFEYTFTVKHCIDTIAGFLKCVEVERHPAIAEILTQFESTVRQCPLGCQICPELVPATGSLTTLKTIGFLYSAEGILVTAHVILSPRQDIPRLLFKRLIMA